MSPSMDVKLTSPSMDVKFTSPSTHINAHKITSVVQDQLEKKGRKIYVTGLYYSLGAPKNLLTYPHVHTYQVCVIFNVPNYVSM